MIAACWLYPLAVLELTPRLAAHVLRALTKESPSK